METKLKAYKRKLPINVSNNSIYEHIYKKVNSKGNIIKSVVDISQKLPLINIQETLDKTIKLLTENNMFYSDDETIIEFKKKLNIYRYESHIVTKIEAEFYGVFLFHLYQNEVFKTITGKELMNLEYKIHQKQLHHNLEELYDEVMKSKSEQQINIIEKLPLLEQKKEYLKLIKEFENYQFLNKTDDYKREIKHFKNNIKRLKEEIKDLTIIGKEIEHPLKQIWLPQAKISIEDFLKKGIDKGIWDEKYTLLTSKKSSYGNGKILLGSLSIALKGWAIFEDIDYNKVGEAFCKMFNIKNNIKTDRPYKSFSSGNPKYIKELKREFKI